MIRTLPTSSSIRPLARLSLVLVAGLSLAGCNVTGQLSQLFETRPTMAVTLPAPDPVDSVDQTLVQHAARVAKALDTLSRTAEAQRPLPAPAPRYIPESMKTPITVSWTGPAVPLIMALARQVRWDFEEVGKKPIIDTVVSIQADGAPAYQVLADIGSQLERDGTTVAANVREERLEVRYGRP